jgi:hypothetical protein
MIGVDCPAVAGSTRTVSGQETSIIAHRVLCGLYGPLSDVSVPRHRSSGGEIFVDCLTRDTDPRASQRFDWEGPCRWCKAMYAV